MNLCEGNGWYFCAREQFIRDQLIGIPPRLKLLDVGCGSGLVAKVLGQCDVTGIDKNPRYNGAICAGAEVLPFPDNSFDAITCFDVLEHVTGHVRALSEIHRVLQPGGTVYITVPLYPRLWSKHDELLGHVRRYRPGEIGQLLESTRFEVIRKSYFLGTLLPVVALVRTIFRRKNIVSAVKLSMTTERLLKTICNIERITNYSLPFGLTEFTEAKVVR